MTTARDMARLANALLRDFPHYYPVFSVLSYNYRGRPLANHNRMLATYAGADGLKTGYTNASGFNLVMSAMRDNRRLIGVVMGGNTAFQRDRLMAELMDRASRPPRHSRSRPGPRRACRPRRAIPPPTSCRASRPTRARRRGRQGRAGPSPGSAPAAPFRFGTAPTMAPASADRQLGDPGRLVQRFSAPRRRRSSGQPARCRMRSARTAR